MNTIISPYYRKDSSQPLDDNYFKYSICNKNIFLDFRSSISLVQTAAPFIFV